MLGVLFGGSCDQRVAGALQRGGNAAYDFRKERMQKIGHHETEHAGMPGYQCTCGKVGAVIHLLAALQHACFCFLTDVGMVAKSFRNGDHGDAQVSRDIF